MRNLIALLTALILASPASASVDAHIRGDVTGEGDGNSLKDWTAISSTPSGDDRLLLVRPSGGTSVVTNGQGPATSATTWERLDSASTGKGATLYSVEPDVIMPVAPVPSATWTNVEQLASASTGKGATIYSVEADVIFPVAPIPSATWMNVEQLASASTGKGATLYSVEPDVVMPVAPTASATWTTVNGQGPATSATVFPNSGHQVPFSVSKTGDVYFGFSYTASNTGTAVYVRGTRTITITITQTGGTSGGTIFIDWSNNPTAPNVNDPTLWSTSTPNGIILHSGLTSGCSVCGTVPDNIVTATTSGIWVKIRMEAWCAACVTQVTGFALGTQ